jgi:predicted RNA-binding Zn-ribbon protein involved in translation (DUF1610 family)
MPKKKSKFVKICPKCNSLNVRVDLRGPLVAFGLPSIYVCEECGFKGYFFPEIDLNEKEELKKD